MLDQLGCEVAGQAVRDAEALWVISTVPAGLILTEINIRGTKTAIKIQMNSNPLSFVRHILTRRAKELTFGDGVKPPSD